MLRDITLIISVLVSFISVGFGIYESVQSKNTRAFAYEQVYRILNVVQNTNIASFQRATITDTVLSGLTEPAPVIDLSRSSADVEDDVQPCTEEQKRACTDLASDLASANRACSKKDQTACTSAEALHRQIISQDCISCFTE